MIKKMRLFVLYFVYIAFLLLLTEGLLQVVYYVSTGDLLYRAWVPNVYVNDSLRDFSVKPHLNMQHSTHEFSAKYVTNSQGFRVPEPGVEYSLDKDKQTYRIMLLGPSFAFGWGVNYEDSFSSRLVEFLSTLKNNCYPKIELINEGVPGLIPIKNLSWYNEEGRKYKPDLVIQFVYGSLNVYADEDAIPYVNDEGALIPRRKSALRSLMPWAKKSATVFYGWMAFLQLRSAFFSDDADSIQGAGRELASYETFRPDDPSIAASLKFYSNLRNSVESRNGKLLVVYFPLSYVVHQKDDVSRWKLRGVRDVEGSIRFNNEFCDYLNDNLGIKCLNITDALIAGSSERLYFWFDTHWTPKGNELTAKAVSEYLSATGAMSCSK